MNAAITEVAKCMALIATGDVVVRSNNPKMKTTRYVPPTTAYSSTDMRLIGQSARSAATVSVNKHVAMAARNNRLLVKMHDLDSEEKIWSATFPMTRC